ncbi:M48 family metallopeptidase [Meiothermus sp. PNK-Is4]|uniref:M48 family metallopeptidase n=1 Tax=Meiothermus sp. PNK-Is4 TaxID=2740565 RepID=UPI0020C1E226|nr:SprT family zinc-dependent metalloprotease [Meiothermus sp. PNK-Is4]
MRAVDKERGQVKFGQRRIVFEIRRSSRRRTVGLQVDAERVLVSAPHRVRLETLQDFVLSKAPWIVKKQNEFAKMGLPPRRKFTTGEPLLYLGRRYTLERLPEEEGPAIRLWGGSFQVWANTASTARKLLEVWYEGRALERIPARVEFYSRQLGRTPQAVYIRDQRSRWGSCNLKGELRFNWRLMMAPSLLLDYVVAHEVCHLLIFDHSPAFWRLLGQIMPDYEERRRRLALTAHQYEL